VKDLFLLFPASFKVAEVFFEGTTFLRTKEIFLGKGCRFEKK